MTNISSLLAYSTTNVIGPNPTLSESTLSEIYSDFCADVSVIGGEESITIGGENAPWHRIQIREENSSVFRDVCNDNCSDPQVVTGLAPGVFVLRIEQGNLDRTNFCSIDVAANVTGPIDFGAGVSVIGGIGEITVAGVTAPLSSIQYRLEGTATSFTACFYDCGNPEVISGLEAGRYILTINQSNLDGSNPSSLSVAAIVTSPVIDFCADVSVIGGEETITIGGVNAPWHRIQIREENASVFRDVCNDNCSDPQIVTGLSAGVFIIRIEQGNLDRTNFCSIDIAANVTSSIDFGADVSVIGGNGEITVSGVIAPLSSIQYRLEGTATSFTACSYNCGNPEIISGLDAGTYIVTINQSSLDGSNPSTVSIAAIVTSPVVDFCADVSVIGGEESITIGGVNAPWQSIQIRSANSSTFSVVCNDNCNDPQVITGLSAGTFVIRIEQGNLDRSNFCTVDIAANVTSAIDFGAGVSVTGSVGEINVSGVTAPSSTIQFRLEGASTSLTACTSTCGNPEVISGLDAGTYIVTINQSNLDGSNPSVVSIAAIVTSPVVDFCAGVSVIGGEESITVNGVNAPWNNIQIRSADSNTFRVICNDNCSDPQVITDLPAGTFVIRVEQGNLDRSDFCSVDIAAIVTAPNKDLNSSASDSRAKAYTDFNAYVYQRAVTLEWATNTSAKSDYYVIEKSTDGEDFNTLIELENNGKETSYFKSIDDQPVTGINHYRLKQVLLNGTETYSEVRSVDFGIDINALSTFPNPAQNELFINLKEFAGKRATIMIANQFGGVVEVQEIDELTNDLVRIDLSEYTNGLYIIRTKIDRHKIIGEKFMISKLY